MPNNLKLDFVLGTPHIGIKFGDITISQKTRSATARDITKHENLNFKFSSIPSVKDNIPTPLNFVLSQGGGTVMYNPYDNKRDFKVKCGYYPYDNQRDFYFPEIEECSSVIIGETLAFYGYHTKQTDNNLNDIHSNYGFENIKTPFSVDWYLTHNAGYGYSAIGNLQAYKPIALTLKNSEYGKSAFQNLSTISLLSPVSEYGENLKTYIAREILLQSDVNYGKETRADFYVSLLPFVDFETINSEYGVSGTGDISLSSVTIRNVASWYGVSSEAKELKTAIPVILPITNAFKGFVSGGNSVNFDFIPMRVNSFTGYSVEIGNWILDKSQWIYSQYGKFIAHEDSTFTLDATFNVVTNYGISANVDGLQVPPAYNIRARSHYSHEVKTTLEHLYSASLFPLIVAHGYWNDVTFDYSTTHFDLCLTCCDNGTHMKGSVFNIELLNYEDPRTKCSAEIPFRTNVELSAEPRLFDIVSYYGKTLSAKVQEPILLNDVNSWKGFNGFVGNVYHDLNVRLTYGNYTPDIHNADVELDSVIPDHEFAYISPYGYVIENSVLRCEYGLRLHDAGYGMTVLCDLFVIQPLRAYSYYGKKAILQPYIEVNSFYGFDSRAELWLQPHYSYYGVESVATVSTDYGVEFTEDGCLENQYIHKTDGLDKDIEETTTHAIELMPFQHDIGGRCF